MKVSYAEWDDLFFIIKEEKIAFKVHVEIDKFWKWSFFIQVSGQK